MQGKTQFNFADRWDRQIISIHPKHTFKTWAMGICGTLLISILASSPWIIEYKIKRDIGQINEKVSALQNTVKLVNLQKSLTTQIEERKAISALVQKNSKDPGPVLEKLKQLFPVGTTISSFTLMADNTLNLTVNTPAPIDVARLWVSLRDSEIFQGVDLQTVSLQDKTQAINLNLKLK